MTREARLPKTMSKILDTTRFINIDNEDFTFHLNNEPIVIKTGEEKILAIYVAEHGAKHLLDKVLQKQGVKNTLTPSEARTAFLARILPDLAEQANVKQVSKEEETRLVQEEIKKELRKMGEEFGEKDALKDKEIAELKTMVQQLMADKTQESRPVKKK